MHYIINDIMYIFAILCHIHDKPISLMYKSMYKVRLLLPSSLTHAHRKHTCFPGPSTTHRVPALHQHRPPLPIGHEYRLQSVSAHMSLMLQFHTMSRCPDVFTRMPSSNMALTMIAWKCLPHGHAPYPAPLIDFV